MKRLFITVDAEEDNSWDLQYNFLKCDNWKNIYLFQNICEENKFRPIYLLTYSMLLNDEFCSYLYGLESQQKCFLGIHIHPWSTPPFIVGIDDNQRSRPIVGDYSFNQLNEKITNLCSLFEKRFGRKPIICRAGRWCSSEDYFNVLVKNGCLFDCSFTPGLDLSSTMGVKTKGNNYKNCCNTIYYLNSGIIEIPMTTMKRKCFSGGNFKTRIKNFIIGKNIWLRPAVSNFSEMVYITQASRNRGHLMFMIHSSELAVGLNPYVKTEQELIYFLAKIRRYFTFLKDGGFETPAIETLLENNKNGNENQKDF